jgi:hypothetical protein
MREDARPASGPPVGAPAFWHRWGELSLLVIAANTIIATLAWVLVGLLLNQGFGSESVWETSGDPQVRVRE